MKALTKMTWVELKLKLREPVGTFFTPIRTTAPVTRRVRTSGPLIYLIL